MNIGHYAKRIVFIIIQAVIGIVAFAVSYFLIRLVLSLLVFIPYEVRHIITSVLAAAAVGTAIFLAARTQAINATMKRQQHPIVTVVCDIAVSGALCYLLFKYAYIFKDLEIDALQSIILPVALAIGDILGYFVGCRLAKTAYAGYIKPTDDDPIERPGKEKSWRDSVM